MRRLLLDKAMEARRNAYAPYSHFLVGSALLAEDGRIFTGCNVENASYGASFCAERAAVARAVTEGAVSFTAIAIVGGSESEGITEECFPCGICRQVLSEFASKNDMEVILWDGKGEPGVYALRQLFPSAFQL